MADTCAACRFWDRYYDSDVAEGLGDCRFDPPRIIETVIARALPGGMCGNALDDLYLNLYPASAFPVTHERSWCGRFEAPATDQPPEMEKSA